MLTREPIRTGTPLFEDAAKQTVGADSPSNTSLLSFVSGLIEEQRLDFFVYR